MRILIKIGKARYIVVETLDTSNQAAIVDSFCDDRGLRPKALIAENLRMLGDGEFNRLEGVVPCLINN